ncbi:MAG TPA: Rieske (2Fe-2S) protein [Candidatus Saccharimonadales bacterium]|nr:Rieske (2Fe-2S) protein [Candidatus Saccharimonadales bacterium]
MIEKQARTQPPYAQIVAAIEEIPGLEGMGEWLSKALEPLTRQRTLMDVLHGRWLGHALHPALSDVPLGMWTSVPVLDLIGDDAGATTLTAVGCIAAAATAVTGTADWSVTYGRDRRLALVHGLANTAVLGLQLGSLASRLRGRKGRGRFLSVAGLAAGAAAAYLGGDLVLDRALTVNHTASLSGPEEWTDVAADADVAEGALSVADVDGRKVLLTRVNGAVCALENTCSHAGGPLNEGTVEDGEVVCPWHGSRFRLSDGAVLAGPATFPQPQLEARKVAGRVQIRGRER